MEPTAAPGHQAAPARDPSSRRALLVEADPGFAGKLRAELARCGLQVEHVVGGAEGLLRAFREPAALLVLGGHLAGVTSRAFAEIVRRSKALEGLRMIRVSSLDEPPGAPEFEADCTAGPGELPAALPGLLAKLGFEPPAATKATPVRAQPAEADARARADTEAAERLARIIVSDIILYNEQKFAQAARRGDLVTALRPEIDEGMALFEQRVPEQVRARRNFVVDELERRARAVLERKPASASARR